jgi:hypothetical protein
LEAKMTCMIARTARVGFVILTGAILTAGMCGDALAKAHKRHLHARGFRSECGGRQSEKHALLVSQQPVRLGPMRYYGGPKSPMWRGPVEN